MDGLELRYSDYALTDDQESVRDAFRDFFTWTAGRWWRCTPMSRRRR